MRDDPEAIISIYINYSLSFFGHVYAVMAYFIFHIKLLVGISK